MDYFALRDDKQFFFYGDSLAAYAVYGGVALLSPDPIGPEAERTQAFAAFRDSSSPFAFLDTYIFVLSEEGDTLVLSPPLIISEDQIDERAGRVRRAIELSSAGTLAGLVTLLLLAATYLIHQHLYSRAVLRSQGPDTIDWVRHPEVERTTMDWEVYPQGMQDLFEAFKRDYPNLPPLYVTENGMSSHDSVDAAGQVDDVQRQAYIKRHFAACSRAMDNGVDVRGYFIWSLMDNFEWASGYQKRFGLVHVDFSTLIRTPKNSAIWYKQFLKG